MNTNTRMRFKSFNKISDVLISYKEHILRAVIGCIVVNNCSNKITSAMGK